MRKKADYWSKDRKEKHWEGRLKWIEREDGSQQYRDHIKKERIRLGLEKEILCVA